VGSFFVTDARREGKPFLFAVAVIAALGGFLFGYDTGAISGALLFIKTSLHASSFQQEAIVGALLVGAAVGAVGAGYLADAVSRRSFNGRSLEEIQRDLTTSSPRRRHGRLRSA
jgi:MFS family permease